jgi:uncharacterized protein (DUF1800 family)
MSSVQPATKTEKSAAQRSLERFTPQTAWEAYRPQPDDPWDTRKVTHLYRRAALGASLEQIERGIASSSKRLVAELLAGDTKRQPAFEQEMQPLRDGTLESSDPRQLKALWIYRILHSPHPLEERMTLFWHDHFATSNAKVNDVRLMQIQNDICRSQALGRFDTMLQEMTVDPATILWLDSNTNKRGHPNENFAREVFELFSLGVGNYTETDIQQAARALTGWSVVDGKAVFRVDEHDDGEKTVLGKKGKWKEKDVVRIALKQPACAMYLARKLFVELVSDAAEPTDELLTPLADGLRARNYNIGWIVGTILESRVFYSQAATGQKVKSPVHFAVDIVRGLEGRAAPAQLADICDRMEQSLYYPPSVKGWDGGSAWLNTTTLLVRQNLAFDLTHGKGIGTQCDPARLAHEHDVAGDEALARFFLNLFLQQPEHYSLPEIVQQLASERERLQERLNTSRGREGLLARSAAHLVLTLPEFQLG